MKKIMTIVAAVLALVAASEAADLNPQKLTFWGKITAVDVAQKQITVFNRKKQMDMKFSFDTNTVITDRKLPIQPQQLEAGQFLKVSYVMKDNSNWAEEVAIRPEPFKKSQEKK